MLLPRASVRTTVSRRSDTERLGDVSERCVVWRITPAQLKPRPTLLVPDNTQTRAPLFSRTIRQGLLGTLANNCATALRSTPGSTPARVKHRADKECL